MPTISIIVPCYNKSQYLCDTLESVLTQTFQDWECIIINDGSTDSTQEIATQYISIDNRFKYIYQKNQGVSAARNNGISLTTGQYILPLDADDLIAPTYIEKAVNYLKNNPKTKLVYCLAEKIGIEQGPWLLPNYSYSSLLWHNSIHNSAIFKRSDFEKTIGYNTNMVLGCEDYDFWLTLLKPDDHVYRIEEVLFYYRVVVHSRESEASKHRDELQVQLYHNHKELYAPFAERIIIEHNNYEKERLHAMEIYKTKAYQLGYALLRPFAIIKNWIKK